MFHLAVNNIGNEIAKNVYITLDPHIGQHKNFRLESLTPNHGYRQFLILSNPDKYKDVMLTIHVSYANNEGKTFEYTSKINMLIFMADSFTGREYKEITDSIEKASKVISGDISQAISKTEKNITDQLRNIATNLKKR